MIFLKNDYSEGMHPNILNALQNTNDTKQIGYGMDDYSSIACDIIRKKINKSDASVHLLVGGTQTNLVAISSFLRPVEAVIATSLAHIAVHETGAIENCGHKVIEVPTENSKMTPEMIDKVMRDHVNEHMVVPKLVFISNSTELGEIYTKNELAELRTKCDEHNLYLYLDGARIGVALACDENDLTLEDIANFCDAFYIGGTKSGAMFGEALIVLNNNLKGYLRHFIKQKGALLAKGRFLGIQFHALLENDLMFKISENANKLAKIIAEQLVLMGYQLIIPQKTNQVFVKMDKNDVDKIAKFCHFDITNIIDDQYLEVRFVTSFATCATDVDKFIEKIKLI